MMKKILIMEMKTLMKILIINGNKMKVLKIYVKRLILKKKKKRKYKILERKELFKKGKYYE